MDALNYKTGRDPNGVSRFGLEFYRFVENLMAGLGINLRRINQADSCGARFHQTQL